MSTNVFVLVCCRCSQQHPGSEWQTLSAPHPALAGCPIHKGPAALWGVSGVQPVGGHSWTLLHQSVSVCMHVRAHVYVCVLKEGDGEYVWLCVCVLEAGDGQCAWLSVYVCVLEEGDSECTAECVYACVHACVCTCTHRYHACIHHSIRA